MEDSAGPMGRGHAHQVTWGWHRSCASPEPISLQMLCLCLSFFLKSTPNRLLFLVYGAIVSGETQDAPATAEAGGHIHVPSA